MVKRRTWRIRTDAQEPRKPTDRTYRKVAKGYASALGAWCLRVADKAVGHRADQRDEDITAETDLEALRRAAELAYLLRRALQMQSIRTEASGGPPTPPNVRDLSPALQPAARVTLIVARDSIVTAGADPQTLDARLGIPQPPPGAKGVSIPSPDPAVPGFTIAADPSGIPLIDIAPTAVEARQIQRFAEEGVQLIRTMGQKHLADLDQAIAQAARTGARYTQLRDLIEARTGITERHAELIARDQIGKINAKITQDTQAAAGITSYIWRTANDQRVRGNPAGPYAKSKQDHWDLRGSEHAWDDPPKGAGPYNQPAHPGESIQCRCYAEPVVPDDLKRPSREPRNVMRQMGRRGEAQDPNAPLVDTSRQRRRQSVMR